MRYGRIRQRLDAIREAGRERRVFTLTPTGPTTARTESGEELVVACSNDYLGLASHEEIRRAARGGGSTGSRLISGSRPVHRQLEEALERWLGRRSLLFGSGYHANLAVFSTLCEEGELVASDEFNHASIIDGLRLSRARRFIVPHATPAEIPAETRLIAVEGLYSMDGDLPPLKRYPTEPWLAVDEAHALACLGPDGRGVSAMMDIQPDVLIGTFGKALGSAGAFVSGPDEIVELLVNAARSFIFTTAMPEPNAAMALAALSLATDELRVQLSDNVEYFRCNLSQLGWAPLGEAHIVPILTGSDTMTIAARLRERGVFAPGIRWPTVPAGQERIRFTVSAAHTRAQLDQICEALGERP